MRFETSCGSTPCSRASICLLQQLLADYPNLLAGDQDSEVRKRWLLVKRELGVAAAAQTEPAPARTDPSRPAMTVSAASVPLAWPVTAAMNGSRASEASRDLSAQ